MSSLFVGIGGLDGVTHYRTVIPARALNESFVVQDAASAKVIFKEMQIPDGVVPNNIIFQMPVFHWHAIQINRAKKHGAKVFASVDDYLPSIERLHKKGNHTHGHVFDKKRVDEHKRCLSLCDVILCSTDWIANKYSSLGEVRLFKNGLDMERYDVEAPERDMGFIIGWSGGTGHVGAFKQIAHEVRDFMWEVPEAKFVSMGDDMSRFVNTDGSLKDRVFTIPWNDINLYPKDMIIFDVALAPSDKNDFFRAKSQLRLYEAGALKIPVIGSWLYDEIEHGVTGFIADKPGDYKRYLAELYDDKRRRVKMGQDLYKYVNDNCSSTARIPEWTDALN